MALATYLDDFDADLETKRVLGIALERTRDPLALLTSSPTDSLPGVLSNLPRSASAIPIFYGALKKLGGALFGD
jgi:hypothetical protein